MVRRCCDPMCITPGVVGTDPVKVAVLPVDVAAMSASLSPRSGVYGLCLLPATLVAGAENEGTEVIESQSTLESFRIVGGVFGLDGEVKIWFVVGAEE
jgi:hypothetical protein